MVWRLYAYQLATWRGPHDKWEGSSSPIRTAVLAPKEWGGIAAVESDET